MWKGVSEGVWRVPGGGCKSKVPWKVPKLVPRCVPRELPKVSWRGPRRVLQGRFKRHTTGFKKGFKKIQWEFQEEEKGSFCERKSFKSNGVDHEEGWRQEGRDF